MIQEPNKKMVLNRVQDQELKLFFFIGKPTSPLAGEIVAPILGYILEDAFILAKRDYPGYLLHYTSQNMPVKDILGMVHQELSPPSTLTTTSKKTFEQFRSELILVSEKFVDGQDQETLKRIIKGLKQKGKVV